MLKIYRFLVFMGMYDEDGAFFHVVSINQESAHDSLRKHLEATYGYDPEEGLDIHGV